MKFSVSNLQRFKKYVCLNLHTKHDYSFFNMFYYQMKSMGTKCVFKHQDLQMFGLKINKFE